MKIIAGNYFGKNIQFVCKCCNCIYEVESKEDWSGQMTFLGFPYFDDYKAFDYEVKCPNCGHSEHLGFDPDDLKGTDVENTWSVWIPMLKKRKDWNERFRVEPIWRKAVSK